MANALYLKAKEKMLQGGINWTGDNIKIILVDKTKYTANVDTHEFVSSVPSNARVATSGNLTGKVASGGAAGAADVTFPTLSGAAAGAVVIFKDTGTETTSPLIAYIDTNSNLPITPNGGDVTVKFPADGNRIFKL